LHTQLLASKNSFGIESPPFLRTQGDFMFNFGWKTKAIGLVILLIVGFAYSIYAKDRNAGYANNPQVGDVYTVKLQEFFSNDSDKSFPYGVMKITSVQNDDITLNIASARYGNAKSVRKSLSKDGGNPSFYSGETIQVKIPKLVELVQSGGITDINR
jgi:hypothetical protein